MVESGTGSIRTMEKNSIAKGIIASRETSTAS